MGMIGAGPGYLTSILGILIGTITSARCIIPASSSTCSVRAPTILLSPMSDRRKIFILYSSRLFFNFFLVE